MDAASPVVIPCTDLDASVAAFVERLGFRLELISPADDPRRALLSGHGVHIELQRQGSTPPPSDEGVDDEALIVSQPADGDPSAWTTGRAGMLYRDLIPGRLGGRFIASHIRIERGGPVPDSVHFHDVRFQMIFCVAGSVLVAYQDQGPPLLLEEGDCFLQPPGIRHRVLECSPGLEVIEIACPAEHDTRFDHELELPTETVHPERDFGGQRFVHHRAAGAVWVPLAASGLELRDTGLAGATDGLAGARVWRATGRPGEHSFRHDGEFLFLYVLAGELTLGVDGDGEPRVHRAGGSVMVPAGCAATLRRGSSDLRLLEVRLPAATP